MTDKPKQFYDIEFRIVSHRRIEASSPEEAAAKFEAWNVTAEEMIADGYDDIEVYDPVLGWRTEP